MVVRIRSERQKRQSDKERWVYFTTAKNEFKLSKSQIEEALRRKLVKFREVENPNYKTGPPARILRYKDIKRNIKKIRKFEKLSKEEKKRREYYKERSKKRAELEFWCDECGDYIRSRPDSRAFEAYYNGTMNKKDAIRLLRNAHNRHAHTDYDIIRWQEYEKQRKGGASWEEAHDEARRIAREQIAREQIKE